MVELRITNISDEMKHDNITYRLITARIPQDQVVRERFAELPSGYHLKVTNRVGERVVLELTDFKLFQTHKGAPLYQLTLATKLNQDDVLGLLGKLAEMPGSGKLIALHNVPTEP